MAETKQALKALSEAREALRVRYTRAKLFAEKPAGFAEGYASGIFQAIHTIDEILKAHGVDPLPVTTGLAAWYPERKG